MCDNFDDKQWGRSESSSVATRPLLPRRAAGRRGAMPQKEYALVWLLNRVRELLTLSQLFVAHGAHSGCQMQQWCSLVRKVCSPSAPIAALSEWHEFAQELQAHFSIPSNARLILDRTRADLEQLVNHH